MDVDGVNAGRTIPGRTYAPYDFRTPAPSLFVFDGLDPTVICTLRVEDRDASLAGSVPGGARLTIEASPIPLPAPGPSRSAIRPH